MRNILVVILLFFLPFLFFPGFSFELPKVVVAEIIIFLLFICLIFQKDFSWRSYDALFLVLLGLVVIFSLIHFLFSATPTAFLGNPTRLQGVFLLWTLILWALVSAKIQLSLKKSNLYLVLVLAHLLGGFLIGSNETGRLVGTIGEPNSAAGYLVFLWPLVAKSLVALPLALTFVFLTGSRSGLIGLLLQITFLVLSRRLKLRLSWAVVICVTLLIFSLILPFFEHNFYENRVEIWRTAWLAGRKNWLFGNGFGNIEHALPLSLVDSSHNFLLDWWVQGGIVGVFLMVCLLSLSISRLVRQKQDFLLLMMLGLLAVLSFNPVGVVILIPFWWLIGQANKTRF